jgi:hypothetical protein
MMMSYLTIHFLRFKTKLEPGFAHLLYVDLSLLYKRHEVSKQTVENMTREVLILNHVHCRVIWVAQCVQTYKFLIIWRNLLLLRPWRLRQQVLLKHLWFLSSQQNVIPRRLQWKILGWLVFFFVVFFLVCVCVKSVTYEMTTDQDYHYNWYSAWSLYKCKITVKFTLLW